MEIAINSERGISGYPTIPIGRYTYYELGDVTLNQLKKEKIIDSINLSSFSAKKPDGLILLGKTIKAYVEFKSNLKSIKKIDEAKMQALEVSRATKSKVLIVSDGKKSTYFNPSNGNLILRKDLSPLSQSFSPIQIKKFSNEELLNLEEMLDQIDNSVHEDNSTLKNIEIVDPYPLARQVWQDIWAITGKSPEQCLYNVVELFIFKFLSDLGILKNERGENAFYHVVNMSEPHHALSYYAKILRPVIKDKFPSGSDGTTIINGTIFVTEKGEPNLGRADLFMKVLKKFSALPSLKYIDRNFKTKLYESFLRQQVSQLGQFFTPRKVVQTIVTMAQVDKLGEGSTVLDPFCGVGGFLLEAINMNSSIEESFIPKNGKIKPKITFRGYDKGSDEKEDQRTIILAKANMLVYLSNIIGKYHTDDQVNAFSKEFNKTFRLLRNNDLGTFKEIDHEPVDLILTNPPYVTSGSGATKEILEKLGLLKWYSASGTGMEGLALEWIVRKLKSGGWAYVVVPDGILSRGSDKNLRKWIREQCYLRGIISLPSRTFYSVDKKTYIVCLEKKEKDSPLQIEPVFTYLVSEIGETRDANRFEFEKNDLPDMQKRFLSFKGNLNGDFIGSERCKIIPIKSFENGEHWLVDRRFWSHEEKVLLGIADEKQTMSQKDFKDFLKEIELTLSDFRSIL